MSFPRLLIISALEETAHEALARELGFEFVVEFLPTLTATQLEEKLDQGEIAAMIVDHTLSEDLMADVCETLHARRPDCKIFELLPTSGQKRLLSESHAIAAVYNDNLPDAFDSIRSYLGVPV